MQNRKGRGLPGVLLFAMAVLLACQSLPPIVNRPAPILSGMRLAFETIEQRDWPRGARGYDHGQPALTVVTRPEDLEHEAFYVSQDTVEALANLDFSEYFGLIVYQGGKSSTGFGVDIQEIVAGDGQIMVLVNLREPAPDEPVGASQTSPYQVVSVEKANLKGVITFVLIDAQTQKILLEKQVTFDE